MRILPILPHGRLDNVLFRSRIGIAERRLVLGEIESELCLEDEAVFPSHFFDHPERHAILESASRNGAKFAVQLSPGAELLEFYEELRSFSPFTLEILMDRAPHGKDLEKLDQLEKLGFELRPVFCPVPEIDAVEAIERLPEKYRNRLHVYSPPGQLRHDELFLLLSDLSEKGISARPYVLANEPELDSESPLQREFRRSHDVALYSAEFEKMGRHSRFRSILASLQRFRFSAAALAVLTFALALVAEPARACGMARNLAMRFFYFIQSWILRMKNPAWFLRTYLPPVYWIFVFPFQKLWWFSRYQIETRILVKR